MSYSPDLTTAIRRALYRLRWKLGKAWGDRVILVGGLVPPFLVPAPPPGIEAHVGTADLDLAVGVFAREDEAYVSLVRALKDCGFVQRSGEPSFRWFGEQDAAEIVLEVLCPEDDKVQSRIRRRVEADGGSGLTAFQVRGIELAARDYVVVSLHEEIAEMGARGPIDLLVVGPATFIALKARALADRDKPKDAYDIVWLCDAWPHHEDEANGAGALADVLLGSSVWTHRFIQDSFDTLRELFSTPDASGPVCHARTRGRTGPAYERDRLFARGLLGELFDALDSGGSAT